MRKFGDLTRLQLMTLIAMALINGGCSTGSSTGMSSGGTGFSSGAGASFAAEPGTVTLSWLPPDENTNGTAVTDLAGYHIHYGTTASDLKQVIDVAGTTATTFEVSNLSPGTYYFAISAYTTQGSESAESAVGSKTI